MNTSRKIVNFILFVLISPENFLNKRFNKVKLFYHNLQNRKTLRILRLGLRILHNYIN